jgi:hypothetical protein
MMNRRGFLVATLAGAATVIARRASAAVPLGRGVARPPVTVYKDASCGCCKKWVEHMQASGFTVTAHDNADMDALKDHYGVPSGVRSCHTALVGLAVPGMVMGSPGMDGPTSKPYAVLAFQKTGATTTFASHT